MKKPGRIKIGKNLQKIRRSHGYTQEKLAEAIDCSARYISDIEQDKSKPSYENLVKICNVFKIGLNDLFTEYLDVTESKAIQSSLSGFETLEQNHKDTMIK